MKQYDYLVVGSGLYGAVFAHEAHLAIFIAKIEMESIFIIMADISFIHLIKWFGTMSINLLNSIIM